MGYKHTAGCTSRWIVEDDDVHYGTKKGRLARLHKMKFVVLFIITTIHISIRFFVQAHSRVRKTPPTGPILSQPSLVHTFRSRSVATCAGNYYFKQ